MRRHSRGNLQWVVVLVVRKVREELVGGEEKRRDVRWVGWSATREAFKSD